MPGGFPLGLDLCNGIDYGTSLSNGGVSVTGGHNTPGAWAQIVAATTADACWMEVSVYPTQATSTIMAVDIGVGTSGNEVQIADKLLTIDGTGKANLGTFSFPVSIPAGTRVVARSSNNAAADALHVSVRLYDGAFTQIEGMAGVDSIGFSATATTGTTLTSGASSTKGSYAQLTASTPRDYAGFFGTIDTTSASDWGLFDIAIGGSGSEVIIKPNYGSALSTGLTAIAWPTQWTNIPAGSRVAARLAAVATAALTVNLTLYGIYQ